ncbi:MAG: OB-fold nucleic acid binding domain-containing protein, partial [Bryobacteraceae bacterium]
AFTAALLNNQPMGFYSPATIVKDAQRHGLKVRPMDVNRSDWPCTLEEENGEKVLRLGLSYLKGLREAAGRAIVRERARVFFASIDDLARRVPELRRDELERLAEAGALNSLGVEHRRHALWQASRAARPAGPLLETLPEWQKASPLPPMTPEERLLADYETAGLTIGPHPMAYCRPSMRALGVQRAAELKRLPHGRRVRVAGAVIVRQRPGTAKGFVFLSLEDETGIANIVVDPDTFERYRVVLVEAPFLLVEGVLQNVDGVISVKAVSLEALAAPSAAVESHDFH